MNKIKNTKYLTTILSLLILVLVSFLAILPFKLSTAFGGHEIAYHSDCIRSLNDAWANGSFITRVYGLILQDFGYGNGLFYSVIPAGTCVVFMNVLKLSVVDALSLEFFIVITIGTLTMFFFVKRIFKSNILALISACLYCLFPYYMTDIYIRLSFSEIFLMMALPMVVFGLYSLVELGDYKTFMFLFTTGYVIGICTHFASMLYVTAIALVYLLINWKKIITNYKYIPFLISCGIIIFISAIYYIPMILNIGGTQTSNMAYGGFSLWDSTLSQFYKNFLIPTMIVTFIIYIVFAIVYFKKEKSSRTANEKMLFTMATITIWTTTPLSPWFALWGPFTIIQFSWRLFSLVAVFDAILLAYLIKNNKLTLKICIPIIVGLVCLSALFTNVSILNANKDSVSFDEFIKTNSGLNYRSGTGAFGADYHPKNADNKYIYHRADDYLIIDANVTVENLANYQTINEFCFSLKENEIGYVVLKIPYSVCNDITISRKQCEQPYDGTSIEKTYETVDSTEYLKINVEKFDIWSQIIIEYPQDGDFDKYLQENPFEFVVLEGSANFTNFVKENSTKYSVEITTSGETTIELPSLYYKGYKLTYTTASGTQKLEAKFGQNGFVETTVTESGKLNVEFAPTYITFANVVSIVGIVMFAIVLLATICVPRKYYTKLANKTTEYLNTHKTVTEIIRFLIVGVIATLVDMFSMGVVMYLMQKSIYNSFINVFINTPTPSTAATLVGTTVGFLVGLVVNYILSILFVFNEKGKSKTAKGFIIFTVLSVIGLGINVLGSYIGFDLIHLNQWLVKIIMVFIVLIYNYISKRLILFRNKKK